MKCFNDLEIIKDTPGILGFSSNSVFKNSNNSAFTKFIENVFNVEDVNTIRVNFQKKIALISYDSEQTKWKAIIKEIFKPHTSNVNGGINKLKESLSLVPYSESKNNEVSYARYGNFITTWEVLHELPGRLRIKNSALSYRKECCQNLEKTLLDTPGIKKINISYLTASVLINYNSDIITKFQLIGICDSALNSIPESDKAIKKLSVQGLPLSTLTMGLSLIPGIGIYTVPLIVYTGWPIFKSAMTALKNKKISVDILDTAVICSCLFFAQFGAGAFMVWILDISDLLLEMTSKHSKGLLDKVFGEQVRTVWILKDGKEIQVAIEKINRGDTVVVSIGEQIPIDGKIIGGDGVVDQHMLTGESAPLEKKLNDKVLAATTLLAGKLYIKVEEAGQKTTASKIAEIIKNSAEYKPQVMSFGERMADKAVIPTLALAGLGMAINGPQALMAILNADLGTGIRVAAPTSVLAHLSKAARSGIVVKKGGALEILQNIDTFIFDKTGTLTQDSLEVKNVSSLNGIPNEQILAYAACAEQRFSHPIAKAIIEKTNEFKLIIPKDDEREYCAGLGIKTVINEDIVRVGSLGFMEKEGLEVVKTLRKRVEKMHNDAIHPVIISINNNISGIIELQSTERPEAYEVIQNLRKRGVKNLVLMSGDHQAPTKKLAEKLEMDNYFAEFLPQDKSNYIRELQKKGLKVAMVGDGINDGAALSLADVSISLKGASDVAIDSADIIFMDGNLAKLDQLYDISHVLKRDLNRSLKMIVIPNVICIVGSLMGFVNIGMSLVLNNVFNMLAVAQATAPLYDTPKQISAA